MTATLPPGGPPATDGGVFPDASAAYAVRLAVFEGPLDLLLHLIKLEEVEITDIPVARIAEQYVEYLELMRELNLDVAGEYLVIAATLAWIKSRMLLPTDDFQGDEDGPDPRAELVARLLEYQRFKEVAGELDERPRLARDVFAALGPAPEPLPDAEREIAVSVLDLVEAYRRALRSAGQPSRPHEIEIEQITVRERMLAVMDALVDRESIEFEEILAVGSDRPSRPIFVATFLAILELSRLAAVRLYQGADELGAPLGPIHVRRAGEGGADWTERISELM